MSYSEFNGDVVTIARDTGCNVIIPHVCNNLGVMGAGVAYRLSKEWPEILKPYQRRCKTAKTGLGTVVTCKVEDKIYVANMIAQSGVGVDTHSRQPIRYGALASCMTEVRDNVNMSLSLGHDISIVAPKFGSGLAGGDWSVIHQMIEEIWLDNAINVIVVNY